SWALTPIAVATAGSTTPATQPSRLRERGNALTRGGQVYSAASLLVGDQVHVDGSGTLHHRGADSLVEQPGQAGAPGRAQHQLGSVDAAGEVQQRGRDVVADHGVKTGA